MINDVIRSLYMKIKRNSLFWGGLFFAICVIIILQSWILCVLIWKHPKKQYVSLYEVIGEIAIKSQNLAIHHLPCDSIFELVIAESFNSWSCSEKIIFLLYYTLSGCGEGFFEDMIELARKNHILSAWKFELEIIYDNTTDTEIKKRCEKYITILKDVLKCEVQDDK